MLELSSGGTFIVIALILLLVLLIIRQARQVRRLNHLLYGSPNASSRHTSAAHVYEHVIGGLADSDAAFEREVNGQASFWGSF